MGRGESGKEGRERREEGEDRKKEGRVRNCPTNKKSFL